MKATLGVVVLVACGGSGGDPADAPSSSSDGQATGPGLSDQHPGDVGLGTDPAVIWFEDFEAGSVAAIMGRYDDGQGMARMALVADAPKGKALALTAGGGVDAVDLYKQLPDHDDVFVRWYVKYDANVPWHHSGMWFGGYNPGSPYPSPNAGSRPMGNDRFSISIEPVHDVDTGSPRFDFYNYWMGMHSWMAPPIMDNGSAYYGNTLVHQNSFTTDPGSWVCVEAHARLNPNGGSAAGAVLEVWKNDQLVTRFDDGGPQGWWIRDKFCPATVDGAECTDYPAPANEKLALQYRSTTAYGINAFWPQNYITDAATGTMRLDQMVVATERIGCMR